MKFKKGQTYELICNPKEDININNINKIIFAFGESKKVYTSDTTGTQDIIIENGKIKIKLSQEYTLKLSDEKVEYEMAIKYKSGKVLKSPVKISKTLRTIIKEVI